MRSSWTLPDDMQLPLVQWEVGEVYLEFNGPQLVSLVADEGTWLAVASDEDDDAERWLRVPVSSTELLALEDGATTLDDVFNKPLVDVVDLACGTGVPLRRWRVEASQLLAADVPAPGSKLANNRGESGELAECRPTLQLDTARHQHAGASAIGFTALGVVLQNFQRVWNAIAQVVVGATTERGTLSRDLLSQASLSAGALAPGSLQLEVHPADMTLFNGIAGRYGRLVEVSADEHELVKELRALQVRVRSTYRDLLHTLAKHNVELYAKWNTQRIFVGPAQASMIGRRLELTKEAEEQRMSALGYFTAVSLTGGSFEFHDTTTDETYSGSLDPQAFSEDSVVVGPSAEYEVDMSVLIFADKFAGQNLRYRLVEARRIGNNWPASGTA